MVETPKWVSIGRILREWGVRGQLRCVPFNPQSLLFLDYDDFYLRDGEKQRHLVLEDARPQGRHWILKFSGIEDPEQASQFRGQEIWFPREHLPPLAQDEHYLVDLEGFQVCDAQGEVRGQVLNFMTVGESEVMELGCSGQKTFLVPYEKDFIAKTDLQNRVIYLTELAADLLT